MAISDKDLPKALVLDKTQRAEHGLFGSKWLCGAHAVVVRCNYIAATGRMFTFEAK